MKIKFMPQNLEFDITPDKSVMELAHEKGIPIHSTCNGMPSCAECRVKVIEGDYNLLPPSKKEINLIGNGYYIDNRRLSCQMRCFGDVVVDTQEHLDRQGSGPVTKKFLSRVQKDSAEQSHSVGDILIQKDDQLMKQLESSVDEDSSVEKSRDHEMFNEMMKGGAGGGRSGSGGKSGGRNRQQQGQRSGGGQQQRQQQARHGGGGQGQPQGQRSGGQGQPRQQMNPNQRGPSSEGGPNSRGAQEASGQKRGNKRRRNRNRGRGGGGGAGGGGGQSARPPQGNS